MYLKNQWIILSLVCLSVKSIFSQQQCMQLQSCMDLAVKTAAEMQQYPVTSGSYSAMSVHSGSVQCRSLRTNFECMINYTPYCLRSEMTRNSPQYISQAKQLLDTHCDQGTNWSNTQCYRKPEIIQNCETMISDLNIGSYNYYSASIPRNVCEKYQRFRHCVYNVILTHCTSIERELFFSYLYDKVQEVSWKCANDSTFFENYERYHPLTSPIYNGLSSNPLAQPPYTYGSNYGSLLNTGYGSTNYYPPGYGKGYGTYYDRNRYPNNYENRYGSYGSGYGLGYPGSESYPTYEESNCIEKTRYLTRLCEESFSQRQKEARNERTSVDIQRKICCSIYSHRSCLESAVWKNCRDNSQNVVDILMGEGRRRELTIGCREYSYDYCNSSISNSLSYLLIVFIVYIRFFKNFQVVI